MYYSKSILDLLVSVDQDPDEVWMLLTHKVCEVEEVSKRGLSDKIVLWYVTSTKDHPDAEKLTVCQVDCWSNGEYQICCWATNVRAGIFVVVALPGCYLPSIDLTIEPRKLRGEDSNGMICSKAELWIQEDLENKRIWSLQSTDDAANTAKWTIETEWDMAALSKGDLWKPIKELFPWMESRTMDIENKTITHRPDMFGHAGLAIELGVMIQWNKETSLLTSIRKKGLEPDAFMASAHDIWVIIESDKVLNYGTILLSWIEVLPSPLQTRLTMLDLGLQTRSNRVDFSNIFMYSTGQPVHFFDADKIVWWLIIRQAKNWERFVDLFDKEHELTPDDIVIADNEKICALAWVIWSNTSGIDEKTKNILVEIANFDPIQVRKTGTRLGLRTDAEIRFEKTINPVWTEQCMSLFLEMLWIESKEIWVSSDSELHCKFEWATTWFHENYTRDLQKIDISREGISKMIGSPVTQEWTKILQWLWFGVNETQIVVPSWRSIDDIETQACIVEEIIRIQGFENIQAEAYTDVTGFKSFVPQVKTRRVLEGLMIDRLGFDQVETYPWIHKKRRELFDIDESWLVEMENSLNPDRTHLRPSMIGWMLEVIQKNAPFFPKMKIMDIWSVWFANNNEILEEQRISFAITQSKAQNDVDSSYLQAKSVIDELLQSIGAKWRLEYTQTNKSQFHPLQQASIHLNKQEIGSLVCLHSYVWESLKLPEGMKVVFGQLNLSKLQEIATSQKKTSRWMSTYETLQDQIISRDINFVVDKATAFGLVSWAVNKIKEVQWAQVFDLYEGEHLPEGKKSIALRLKIKWEEELKTEQINSIMEKVVENVKWVGGELR